LIIYSIFTKVVDSAPGEARKWPHGETSPSCRKEAEQHLEKGTLELLKRGANIKHISLRLKNSNHS